MRITARTVIQTIMTSLAFVGAFLATVDLARAQNSVGSVTVITPALQTGTSAGGSYEGDQESVSMSNGAVNVRVPLVDLPGLGGLDLKLDLIVNSNRMGLRGGGAPTQTEAGTSYNWNTWQLYPGPSNDNLGFAGGRLSIPELTTSSSFISVSGQSDVRCYSGFVITDTDGAQHAFQNVTDCYQGAYRAPSYEYPSIDDTYDGSFMRLDTSNPNDIIAYLKSGVQYHFNLAQQGADFSGWEATRVVDPNGNQITFSGTYDSNNFTYSTTITDSEGRSITVTPAGVSYTDANGSPRNIAMTSTAMTGSQLSLNSSCVSSDWVESGSGVQNFGNAVTQDTLTFPTGSAYVLTYDALQELVKIVYPPGGYTRYDYQSVTGGYFSQYWNCQGDVRQISAKHQCSSSSGACSSEDTTTYAPVMSSSTGVPYAANQYMDVRDPVGNRTRYEFSTADWAGVTEYGAGSFEINRYLYSGESNLIETIHTDYTTDNTYPQYAIRSCSLPITKTTTLNDVSPNLQSKVVTGYDTIQLQSTYYTSLFCGSTGSYISNPISIQEYNYDGTLKRTTSRSWYSRSPSAPHILDRVSSQTVTDPSGFQTSYSYGYDGAGNVASYSQYGSGATSVTTTFVRNSHGDATQIQDPSGNITTLSYSSPFNDGNCPATASGKPSSATNALGQVTYYKYSSCTGNPTSVNDPNQQTTKYSYDSVGRRTNVAYPDGGNVQTTFEDTPQSSVSDSKKMDLNRNLTTVSRLDGFGRKILDQQPNGAYIGYGYDSRGHLCAQSNPSATMPPTTGLSCLASANSSLVTAATDGIAYYSYDALGRTLSVTHQDGSSENWQYLGNTTTFTDERKNQWSRKSDALGRLVTVLEPDGANQNPTMETDYAYDGLNNLLSVTQLGTNGSSGTRKRTFSYDGLSRLVCASNPENSTGSCPTTPPTSYITGTIAYAYDANGNVLTKTSPAVNVASGTQVIGYCHDALNRVTAKLAVTPSASLCANPPVGQTLATYFYDTSPIAGAQYTVGRLTDEKSYVGSTLVSERQLYSYDSIGRLLGEYQYTMGKRTAAPTYAYDLVGDVGASSDGVTPIQAANTQFPCTPPSAVNSWTTTLGFVNCYDSAGHLSSLTSNWSSYPINIFTAGSAAGGATDGYAPSGQLQNWTQGASVGGTPALWMNESYNNRLWVNSITATGQVP